LSNAEARSWWADVQHLRPDAPAGPVLVSEPEHADAGGTDPLLVPEPGRRFVRGAAEGRDTRDRDPAAAGRRIVISGDDHLRDRPSAAGEATAAPATDPDVAPRADVRLTAQARAAGSDVDFDFGRATKDRARRRTAERLESAPGRGSRHASAAPARARVAADPRVVVDDRSPLAAAAGAGRRAGESAADPERRPASGPPAASAGDFPRPGDLSTGTAAGQALVPLAPPPTRGGVLGRHGRASRKADGRPRRPRRSQTASQPDRIALWAVVLGILLIALAAASSRAEAAPHESLPPAALTQQAPAPPPVATTVAALRG